MGTMRGAANEIRRRTGCGFLPEVTQFLGRELEREVSGRTREFYEFVLPPVDMYKNGDEIMVVVDMPGFAKDQIRVNLEGRILHVSARREVDTKEAVYTQRPSRIEKRIKIPTHIRRGEEPECPASLKDGMLTITVPAHSSGRDITID